MVDKNNEPEPFDIYTDAFTISVTAFGANLSFELREPHPSPGRPSPPTRLGTLRMSIEHLKTMVMIIRRQIKQAEDELDVKADVSRRVLNQLGIPLEDWEAFWK